MRTPREDRSNSRKNGAAAAIGCTVEHTSWWKPGRISSSVRMPPPGRSPASTTRTRRPAAASRRAAASPLGPAPTTTASGEPFTSRSLPVQDGGEPLQLLDQLVGGGVGVGAPGHDRVGQGTERRGPVDVADPLAQRRERDRLDLPGRPLAAPAVSPPRRLQPLAVRLDLLEHLVDAVAGLARGDRLDDRWSPRAGLGVPPAEREHVPQVAHGLVGAVPVGLVHDEDVGHLEDPGLGRLDPVAHPRRDEHQRGVGQRGDLELRLPDTDGLDQDDVAAGGVEHPHRLRRRPRQPAEVPPRGHRADVDAAVAGVVLHAHAVAEQRPAGERGRRVDREHADPLAGLTERAHERRRRRRLADTRGTGEPEHLGVPGVRGEGGRDLAQRGAGVLDQRDQPGDRARVAVPSPCDELGDVDRTPGAAGGRQPPGSGRGRRPDGGLVDLRHAVAGTCRISASPWPPPPQRAAAPTPPPRRRSSSAVSSTIRAPLMPIGWPSAMAPPLGLTFSGSMPSSRVDTMPTAAKASLSSTRSRSAGSIPSRAQAFWIARDGWLCSVASGPATTPWAPISASTVQPSSAAFSALMTTTAQAPSEICEAVPAVIVPSLAKAGLSLDRLSTVVSGRMPSSSRNSIGSPLRCGMKTGVISSSKIPFLAARAAFWWLSAAKASCSSRVRWYRSLACSVSAPMAIWSKVSDSPS